MYGTARAPVVKDPAISAEKSKEQKLRAELSSARQNEFSYQKDLAELSERQQRQRELVKILPTDTEYPAFLSAVQNVANVSGIALTAWSPLPEEPDQFYSRVPMKVSLTGRYHQIAKFFHGVGQLDRVINMENISLIDPKVDGSEWNCLDSRRLLFRLSRKRICSMTRRCRTRHGTKHTTR